MCIKLLWIIGILFFIYGILVSTVGSGTGFFVVWLGLGFMIIIFAFSLKIEFWQKVPLMIKGILTGVFLLGMIVFLCFEGMVIRSFRQNIQPDLDIIMVLGAQIYENGPSVALRCRLDKAIEYMEENEDTICIVTGGQGFNEPFPEAVGMAEYLKDHGVAKDRILLEAESKTTEENIRNSMPMIPEGSSLGIVTNNFHVFRALQIARGQGLKEVCGIPAKSNLFFLPNNMFREFFGEVKYLIKNRI